MRRTRTSGVSQRQSFPTLQEGWARARRAPTHHVVLCSWTNYGYGAASSWPHKPPASVARWQTAGMWVPIGRGYMCRSRCVRCAQQRAPRHRLELEEIARTKPAATTHRMHSQRPLRKVCATTLASIVKTVRARRQLWQPRAHRKHTRDSPIWAGDHTHQHPTRTGTGLCSKEHADRMI